jgi:hypothetical protein
MGYADRPHLANVIRPDLCADLHLLGVRKRRRVIDSGRIVSASWATGSTDGDPAIVVRRSRRAPSDPDEPGYVSAENDQRGTQADLEQYADAAVRAFVAAYGRR